MSRIPTGCNTSWHEAVAFCGGEAGARAGQDKLLEYNDKILLNQRRPWTALQCRALCTIPSKNNRTGGADHEINAIRCHSKIANNVYPNY
jgi:hypothetical protein